VGREGSKRSPPPPRFLLRRGTVPFTKHGTIGRTKGVMHTVQCVQVVFTIGQEYALIASLVLIIYPAQHVLSSWTNK
jgi:hypothetical protein